MRAFILRRLAALPLVVAGVTLLLFALTQLLSPEMRASLYVKDPRQLDSLAEIIKTRGLNDPVLVQYGRWLGMLARGELGYSETANMPVTEAIKAYLPATLELSVATMAPVLLLGIWLGTLSAVKKDRWADHLIRAGSITSYSLPIFVLGLLLLMFFYGKLGWFEPGRYSLETDYLISAGGFTRHTGLLTIDALLNRNMTVFLDALKHLVLPAFALCIGSAALMIRVMRSSMLEELGKDYVRTARAKGLPEWRVRYVHAGKNALIPVITVASLQFVKLLGGVVIIETVFAFPGIGRWGVTAAQQLDIPGVLGFALMTSLLFVTGNLLADIAYAWADPRIRYR
ncbi:MAG: ABC transporter permease [Elusimicrobiaceae bacterium]|nr:ABC transporter permease [Elusimicrobiaceae bacterium]